MNQTLSAGEKTRNVRIPILFFLSLLLLVTGPKTANACVFCLEHMGVDAAMFWTNDVMVSFRLEYLDQLVSAHGPVAGGLHASQALLTQENSLQILITSKWMLQIDEPIYYRWNWPGNVGTASYTTGLGNNNPGYVFEPGDLWIGNLIDVYDKNTFSGSTRVVLLGAVHFPTAPTMQAFNNLYTNADLTGTGQYEATFGLEVLHGWSNGRWFAVADFLNSFEFPSSLGTQAGDEINTDYQIEYKLSDLHPKSIPETWVFLADYIDYVSSSIQVNPVTINGVTTPAGPIPGTEVFLDAIGAGFQSFPVKKWPNLMVFASAEKYVYWSAPGTTPTNPAVLNNFNTTLGFMVMW